MFFGVFSVISLFLALVALYFGFKLLRKLGWVVGFLRGFFGLAFIACAVVLVMASLDVLSYKELLSEKPIVTISFTKEGEQLYKSKLVFIEEGEEASFDVRGEQWQIDARVIRWLGVFQMLGAKPAYRLDRLSGRYYSLEDERRKDRSVHQLTQSEYGLDMWQWAQQNGRFLPIIEAVYGSATYLPMEDGAIFQVSLSTNGLTAKPLNEVAKKAVNRWM